IDAVMSDMDGRFDVVLAAPAGTLTVTGLSDEHDAVSQPVAIAQDEAAAVRLTVPRQFARLHVESDPGGQQPRVDGVPAADCPATPCDTRVTAGVHRLTFADDLFIPWEQNVQVDKDATGSVSAKLERKTGTLAINGPGGELSLDGQALPGGAWSGTV